MKYLIFMILLITVLVGCGNNQVPMDDEPVQEEDTEPVQRSDEEINFKCSNAAMQTFYFLGEDKIKIEANGMERESWLIDDVYYMKMDVGGTIYLVEQEAFEDYEMTVEAMKSAYKTSKKVEGFDCEVGVVTEDMMELPDFPRMTNEQLGEKMLEQMTQGIS